MRKKLLPSSPLKTVFIVGLILTLIISWSIVIFALVSGRDSPGRGRAAGSAFARSLRDYDNFNAPGRVMDGINPNQIERRLSTLQRQARNVDEHLSVLKRRRELALIDRSYIVSYAQAAQEAALTFPYSVPLAAVAAEATLMAAPSENSQTLLKNYASRMTQNRFDLLALSLHMLAGNLDSPSQAAAIPAISSLFSLDLSGFPEETRNDLLIHEFLLLAYEGDSLNATRRLNSILFGEQQRPTRRDTLMGAEFFYDHGFPHRAAELFLQLGGDADNVRAADALVLAGEVAGARNIWFAMASPSPQEDSQSRQIRLRSLYNLAASSANQAEETMWLERLFTQQRGHGDRMGTYSVIRYTRLLDQERSTAILDDEISRQNPLLDLELLRRRQETWPHRRTAAETWLLVGRHSEEEFVYEWAAWYFEHQRLYAELAHLLVEAGRNRTTGSWYYLHRGLALIRDGRIAEAERVFREEISLNQARSPG